MDINTLMIIRSNPNIYKYLRENSYWYKYLYRNPSLIKNLEEEMIKKYKLTTEDKLQRLSNSINIINSFMDVFK